MSEKEQPEDIKIDNKGIKYIPMCIKEILAEKKIPKESVLAVLRGDFDPAGDEKDIYMLLQKDGIIVLIGMTEKVIGRSAARKSAALARDVFVLESSDFLPFTEVKDFKSTQMHFFTSFEMTRNGTMFELCRFMQGKVAYLNKFKDLANKLSKGEEAAERDFETEEDPNCPKCGRPYPEHGRKFCPQCMDKGSIIKRLAGVAKPYRHSIFIVIAIAIAGSILSALLPYVSGRVFYDEVLTSGGTHYGNILYFILLLIAARVWALFLGMINGVIMGKVSARMVFDFRRMVFDKMQSLSLGFFSSRQTGSLMNRVNSDAENLYWIFLDGLPYLLTNVMTIIAGIALMIGINWKLTLIAFVSIPVPLLMMYLFHKVIGKYYTHRWWRINDMSAVLNDSLGGVRVVKVFSKEGAENERFSSSSNDVRSAEVKLGTFGATFNPLVSFIMGLGGVLIWAIGGWLVITNPGDSAAGGLTLGGLMTFSGYINMVYGPFWFFGWFLNNWMDKVASAQRIFEIIDSESDVKEAEKPVFIERFDGSLEFEDVAFSYEAKRDVLKEITFKIGAGQTIGVVGRTGAGKTTLANLILRMYDVKQGFIKIDGTDIKDIAFNSLRSNIGVVSQETFLFMGSIAENIKYSKPESTMEQVITAAKMANAHDFILKLSDGYDTYIGPRGINLSGGERQRISIARAILHNPKILILDEATASMDTETERKIQASLNSLVMGRTTVIIAHRLSTLRDADFLVVIDDGKMAESGTHSELFAKKGIYYDLYKIQTDALKNIGVGE